MANFRPLLICGALILLATGHPARAADKEVAWVIATQVQGAVSVKHGQEAAQPLQNNVQVGADDLIETTAQASVVLVMPNGSTVAVKEKSRVAITAVLQGALDFPEVVSSPAEKPETTTSIAKLDLLLGEIVVHVRKLLDGSEFSVKTPAGTAQVKGTEFQLGYGAADANEGQYQLGTASGMVAFTPEGGKAVEVGAGRQINVGVRRGKVGEVKAAPLAAETRERIRQQNELAAHGVKGAMDRMHALRRERQKEKETKHPEVPPKRKHGG